MRRLSIARLLLLALVGLTLVLAVLAALEVAAIYDASFSVGAGHRDTAPGGRPEPNSGRNDLEY